MTTLYLVRHGQTIDNARQIMQGQRQGELTPEGVKQIEILTSHLSHIHFDAFVSSDLRRAFDSCSIIAKTKGMNVVTTPLLRERDWGDFTGRFIPELKGLEFPSNVETMDAMKQRAKELLKWIGDNYPEQTVLAVGHGIINKVIQSVYHNQPISMIKRMENAEYRILEIE